MKHGKAGRRSVRHVVRQLPPSRPAEPGAGLFDDEEVTRELPAFTMAELLEIDEGSAA